MSRPAKAYVAVVIALGGAAGAHLFLSGTPLAWDWPPIVLFGLLGVLSSAVSLTYQGYFRSRIVYEIGTSFAYALLLLVDPGAVCLVLWIHVAADWGCPSAGTSWRSTADASRRTAARAKGRPSPSISRSRPSGPSGRLTPPRA